MQLINELLALPDIRQLQAAAPVQGTVRPLKAERGDPRLAEEALRQGRVGCVVLAGGQATRLGLGPKALVVVDGKTLLQHVEEKVAAARKRYGARLPLAIMCSPFNREGIEASLQLSDVTLFTQSTYPVFVDGKLQLASPFHLARAPSGNGVLFQEFTPWEGIDYYTTILIDNPLADPFSLDLIGVHLSTGAEMSGIAIKPRSDEEKVGLFVELNGRPAVVEYSERGDVQSDLANTSLFCFSSAFSRRVPRLPLHAVQRGGVTKYEHFIFDAMAYCKRFAVIELPRQACFAPLKNSTGDDSIETVQAALRARRG